MSLYKELAVLSGYAAITFMVMLKVFDKIIFPTWFQPSCKDSAFINDVLVYGRETCKEKLDRIGKYNLKCIIHYIAQTQRRIYVCMSKLTSETITKSIIALTRGGNIEVKILIHQIGKHKNKQIKSLCDNGIQVKIVKPPEQLQHEFILIDAMENCSDLEAVLLIGALDYSFDNVNSTCDSTIITSLTSVVEEFRVEFERHWTAFENQVEEEDPELI